MSETQVHAIVTGDKYHAAKMPGGNNIVLLTATVRPPQAAVARSNYSDRISDYLDALQHYIALPPGIIDRILFVDNSLGGVEPIIDAARGPHDKQIEIISFRGNDHPVSRGKAYGEFKLLDEALTKSAILTDDALIWKVTGRLKLLNIELLQRRTAKGEYDIICDLHNVPLVGSGRLRGNSFMDLRVFGFRRAAYNIVYRGAWDRSTPFDMFEVFDITREAQTRVRVLPRFPIEPRLQGVSGRHLRDYNSPAPRLKSALRGSLRYIAPSLWI